MPFPLLALPAELRLRVYDYMLNPSTAKTGVPSRTRINWIYKSEQCSIFSRDRAHEVSSEGALKCACTISGSPWLPGLPSQLSPAILAASRFVYEEALPRLYERRLWEAVNFRTFGTQHEACLERWWIMDCFLASLSADARRYVTSIRVPMIVSLFETYGCADAFLSIQAKLPRLQLVEVQSILAGVLRGHSYVDLGETRYGVGSSLVWPVMMFSAEVRFVYSGAYPTSNTEGEPEKFFWIAQQSEVDAMKEKRRMRAQPCNDKRQNMFEDDSLRDIGTLWESPTFFQ